MHQSPHRSRLSFGFTLVEILVAMTIMGLATVGIVGVLLQALKIYYTDRGVLGVNRDIRSFTSQMDTDAVTSNFYRLYADFNTRKDSSGNDLSLDNGQIGDFVVFVYTDPSQTSQGVSLITRLVGYYREVTNTTLNTGPVHRFDVPINNVDATSTTIADLLNSKVTGSAASYPIVTQLAQGLAINAGNVTTPTPKLFYDFNNCSVMVNAQISESANEVQNSTARIGNTYNFTISPRG